MFWRALGSWRRFSVQLLAPDFPHDRHTALRLHCFRKEEQRCYPCRGRRVENTALDRLLSGDVPRGATPGERRQHRSPHKYCHPEKKGKKLYNLLEELQIHKNIIEIVELEIHFFITGKKNIKKIFNELIYEYRE